MQYYGRRGRVPWTVDHATRGCSFETKDESRCGVGRSPRSKGGQIILGACQLLSTLCIGICRVGIPTALPNEEGYSMDVRAPPMIGIPEIKRSLCNAPLLQYPEPSKPYAMVTDVSALAVGVCVNVGPRPRSMPLSIHESSSEASQPMVLGL